MDMFGIKKIQLDDDPLKDKIKQARVSRKLRQYENAIGILHESLIEASNRKDDSDSAVTYVLDELANTYYEKGDIEEADKNFREVLKRFDLNCEERPEDFLPKLEFFVKNRFCFCQVIFFVG